MRFAPFVLLLGLTLPAAGTIQVAADIFLKLLSQLSLSTQQDSAREATLPVANLRHTVLGTTVRFEWDPSSESIVSYILEAGSATGLSNVVVFDTKSTATTFTVPNVPLGVYFVRVRALGSDGIPGPPSNEVIVQVGVQCSAAPNSPTALTQQVTGNQVFFSWLAPAFGDSPTSYIVEAGTGSGLADLAAFDIGSATPSYTASAPTGVYFVRVRATNSCGVGPLSNEAIVTIGCEPPSSPLALASQINGDQVTLSWSPPLSGGPITSYMMEAGTASGLSNIAAFETQSSATTLTQPGVPPGKYWLRARARNACGVGAVSQEISFEVAGGPGPIDCVEGPWSDWQGTAEWSACTNGLHSRPEIRTRSIIRPPQNGGRACGPLEETRNNTESCTGPPVDCVVSDWSAWQPISEWSACVNSERSRTERRTRTVVTHPANGGKACPELQETRQVTDKCVSPPATPTMGLYQTQPDRGEREVPECQMTGSKEFSFKTICELRGSSTTQGVAYDWKIEYATDPNGGMNLCEEGAKNGPKVTFTCTCFTRSVPTFSIKATLTVSNAAGQATTGPNTYTVMPAT